ncbi:hypothetical protein FB465_3699 [Kitasatospora atroaurantiaca]|uniref:Uncharacterized protein n=1 Tax=Kitasatospora atroaurantiaca TaxID=285545 RepID=A0A561ESM8_9ACTN|nr:hypothetical protein [Kitasatospora atroaurantiaca]TWE18618.1 hypothetical protein FB465_3699 [Kitasatospora atroaurantiaca]
MSRKPSISEIGAFLANLRANAESESDPGPLLAEKADLLERIARNNPDDRQASEVAHEARAAADRHRRNAR